MTIDPATRRANRWLLIALVIFAFGLCAVCLLWMRYRIQRDGGVVYPPPKTTLVAPARFIRPLAAPSLSRSQIQVL